MLPRSSLNRPVKTPSATALTANGKTVITESGPLRIDVPSNRDDSFELGFIAAA